MEMLKNALKKVSDVKDAFDKRQAGAAAYDGDVSGGSGAAAGTKMAATPADMHGNPRAISDKKKQEEEALKNQ